jgi:hypothetical protein
MGWRFRNASRNVLSLHDLTALLRGRQVSAGLWADSGEAGLVPQQPEPLKQASYRMLKDASGRLFHRPAEGRVARLAL